MNDIALLFGSTPVTFGQILLAGIAILIALLALLIALLMRTAGAGRLAAREQNIRTDELEERLGEMVRSQSDTAGRLQAMGEALAGRQSDMARAMSEQLSNVSHRVGQSMEQTTRHTMDSLRVLHERLGIIDSAQKNLTDLTDQVTTLRDVLANKQTRGAFGQARMETIVQDAMPAGAYAFQYTLSNRSRPDCVVFLPDQRPLVIDAKFPLEAVTALREANGEDARKAAAARLRQDIGQHIKDIAGKYLIAGETQDTALMFVPSESVYADIYDGFDDLIQKAYRARVVLVSPSLLMLAIQVMQQILKDARMREAASLIQTEVNHMMDDVRRLGERVVALGKHFGNVSDDVRNIMISIEKIERRATRINELEFNEPNSEPDNLLPLSSSTRANR